MRAATIALAIGLAAACAFAGPARADVTYVFTPTSIMTPYAVETTPSGTGAAPGSECGLQFGSCPFSWDGTLTLTFTNAAVASGSASFNGVQAYDECSNSLACANALVAASGFVSATGNVFGVQPFDMALDSPPDGGYTGFDLTFNPDGTLSGSLMLADGIGDLTENMQGGASGWSGEGGTCEPGATMCEMVGYWSDPALNSVPAPSSLALLLSALGLLLLASRPSYQARR